MQGKKKIRRRRGPKQKPYFSKETQACIQQYQGMNDPDDTAEKEKLYVEKIFPAFDKLAENLIFVYGFINHQESYINLKSDCVSFLYETIHKWDPERGTKAFSYFNVVAKNWLIMNARKMKRRTVRHVSLSDYSSMSPEEKSFLANFDIVPAPDEILIKRNLRNEILEILEKIRSRVRGQKESACIEAIITVFMNLDQLDFLNKRAIFVYVRDISGLNPKQLSVSMSSIRKHYKDIVKEKTILENIL
tara:strand:+ start:493 stop:1233 length:741 start_codon:yes stop_codon:yes gene_type:complete